MESIIVRSFNRHGGALGNPNDEEKFEVTAELRVYPCNSKGSYDREIGSKVAKCYPDGWLEVIEPNNGMYLSQLAIKYFKPETTIAEVYDAFKKDQDEWQAEYTELIDKAIILERFIKLSQEAKNE